MRVTLLDILRESGILSLSKSRRLLIQGAVKLNGADVTNMADVNITVIPTDTVDVGDWSLPVKEIYERLENK